MPLAESMISTLKSNKNIMLDKSRRFRKTLGGYDWSKKILINLPKASEKELREIRERIYKQNRSKRIKELILFLTIFIIMSLTFLYLLQ